MYRSTYYKSQMQNDHISIVTIMVICFPTDRSGQTVQTRIRLLLVKEQSDLSLHCLQFHLHLFKEMSRVMRKPTFWFSTWSDTNQAVQQSQ